jgi:spore germination protein YaaH
VASVRLVVLALLVALPTGCLASDRGPSPPTSPSAGTGAASPTPGPSVAPSASPSVPPPAALTPFGYRAKGMTHEVMAFVNHGHLEDEVPRLQYEAISTVVYFSIVVNSNGRINRKTVDWRRWIGKTMDTLIRRAHAAGTKVVPSIKRFAWTNGGAAETRKFLSDPAARQRAANEIAQLVYDRGVDGVNIDVEPVPRGQSGNMVKFVRLVRQALDKKRPGYQLTFCATGHIANYDVKRLTQPGAADAVYIMGYQYRGSFSTIAGSVAPVGGPHYNYRETLRQYLKQTKPDKIVLGVPLFGWSWLTETSGVRSRIAGGSRALFYRSAAIEAANRAFRYDTAEEVAWTAFRSGTGWRQMYFDNLRALEAKWNFVIKNKLRGTGLWALGFEGTRTKDILGLLGKKFRPAS